ncbi:MAG: Uma2 family endonuclease [Symploca sp. SIO2E6]|nr:Uma2 family endonuclease [Symploca sp. SIO2E6]
MVGSQPLLRLPTSEELPCSDETPVDNELQNLIPNLLLTILASIWRERQDWFFGVDMGVYYLYEEERQPVVTPDGFLSVGVARRSSDRGRLSYVLWEENDIPPVLAIEIVSKHYNDEYSDKKEKYAKLGVKYYLIYNPNYWQRDKHQPFELYRLKQGKYILQTTEPYWIPEIGLSIGRSKVDHLGWQREWLLWYDREDNAYPIPEEVIKQLRQRAEQEYQRAQQQQQLAEQEYQRAEQQQQLAEQERQRAEQQQQLAEQERQRAEQQQQLAEQERQRAEQQQQLAEQERQRAQQQQQLAEQERQRAQQQQQLAERAAKALQEQQQQTVTQLFSLGLTIEQIATACNLTPNQVKQLKIED